MPAAAGRSLSSSARAKRYPSFVVMRRVFAPWDFCGTAADPQPVAKSIEPDTATALRSWLHGKVPDKRLLVLKPKLDAGGIDDTDATKRVDFGLH
jgi:hypothetical protein